MSDTLDTFAESSYVITDNCNQVKVKNRKMRMEIEQKNKKTSEALIFLQDYLIMNDECHTKHTMSTLQNFCMMSKLFTNFIVI